MSETEAGTAEVETDGQATETEPDQNELPAHHPLVKKLALQKAEIKDLKGKAARLAKIEDEQKSDAEKAADRIAKAEAEVAAIPEKVADALKAHLVELHKIDAEDADLLLNAKDPETLLKQVSRLLGSQPDKRRTKSNSVSREGNNPQAAPSDEAAFARDLLGG